MKFGRTTAARCACLVAMLATPAMGGCRRSHAPAASEARSSAPAVRDTSDALLFTWIDDKGDFHVETRVADVPAAGRETVRVVDPGKSEEAQGDQVFVADLRQAAADGSYAVRAMPRAEFEALAVARRAEAGPTLVNVPPPSAPSSLPAAGSAEPPAIAKDPRGGVVIVYGAEWCGACHEAMRYLRRKGVAYVEKDVEKDPSAEREMQEKLARNGLRGGSIPVLDVRGKVMIGFNPSEVDAALGEPL
ncbi:MAG TPA: glutaredoxin domain-containing protein [Polyangiaceae bacterium]